MGRKIPAKKHRGVKDPLVQQARRLQSLQRRVNSPPRDPDEQPVPRSLLRLFPAAAPPRPARSARPDRPARRAAAAPLGALRRGAGEGAKAFSQRITAAVRALSTPAAALQYPVESERSDEESPAERAAVRRRRRNAGGGGGGGGGQPAPNRKERRKQRLRERREAERQRGAEAARGRPRYERVPFGEVAPAPPRLSHPVKVGGEKGTGAGAGLAGAASAARGEEARRAAVAAYRALKAQRRAAHSAAAHSAAAAIRILK